MKKRIGTKLYDTDKAVLVDTLPDGVQVYRKKNSPLFFIYNPNGKTGREMFFDLPSDQVEKYLDNPEKSKKVRDGTTKILVSPFDSARIKKYATMNGMSMAQFLLMLVDEYEKEHAPK